MKQDDNQAADTRRFMRVRAERVYYAHADIEADVSPRYTESHLAHVMRNIAKDAARDADNSDGFGAFKLDAETGMALRISHVTVHQANEVPEILCDNIPLDEDNTSYTGAENVRLMGLFAKGECTQAQLLAGVMHSVRSNHPYPDTVCSDNLFHHYRDLALEDTRAKLQSILDTQDGKITCSTLVTLYSADGSMSTQEIIGPALLVDSSRPDLVYYPYENKNSGSYALACSLDDATLRISVIHHDGSHDPDVILSQFDFNKEWIIIDDHVLGSDVIDSIAPHVHQLYTEDRKNAAHHHPH